MAITTIRLSEATLKDLDELAELEGVDRTTVMKRALEAGVREIKIDLAIGRYQKGLVSAWKAAEEAGVNLWEFIDVLEKREIGFMTSEEEFRRMLEDFG